MANLFQRNDICVTVDHKSSKIPLSNSLNFAFLVQSSNVVWVDLHIPFCGQQHPKCWPIIFFVNSCFFCKVRFHQTHKHESSEDWSGENMEGTILRARFKHLYFGNHNRTHAQINFFSLTMANTVSPFPPQTFCMCRFQSVFMLTTFLPKLKFGRAQFRCHMQHLYNINFNYMQNI
jgi:hypothetical protein